MKSLDIPVLDLGGSFSGARGRHEIARAFGHALETTGFVTIINHRVPEPVVTDTYDALKAFFALPQEVKLRYNPPEKTKGRGYLPIGVESVAATLGGRAPPDLCEALVFRSLRREQRGIGAPNLWPDRPEHLKVSVHRYFEAMTTLCSHLMRLSALALNLPEEYFDASFSDPSMVLRFVNYPDQLVAPLPGQLRYGAHNDYGGLTIVRQDDAPGGLEVCDADGDWHPVPNHPGSFVINVGALLSRWTNGRWPAALHRVVNPGRELTGSAQRLSLVLFSGPNENTEIACLPSCHNPQHPARFRPVNAGEFVMQKLAASMDLSVPE